MGLVISGSEVSNRESGKDSVMPANVSAGRIRVTAIGCGLALLVAACVTSADQVTSTELATTTEPLGTTTEPVADIASAPTTLAPPTSEPGEGGPSERMYSHLVGVGEEGVILIGGFSQGEQPAQILLDMWALGPDGWMELTPDLMPPPAPAAAYDVQSGRIVMDPLAGCVLPGGFGPEHFDAESCETATWVYDPAVNAWERWETPVKPTELLGSGMTYDSESDRVILFAGWLYPTNFTAETWAYDYETNVWTQMSPEQSPPPRNYQLMDYDAQSDRVLMFGGDAGDESVWAFDFNADTWTELPAADPSPQHLDRYYGRMVYEPAVDRMIVYGGVYSSAEQPVADTWAYDYDTNTWTELSDESIPGPRGWHAMAYYPGQESMVMFGGGPRRGAPLADTWLYDFAANEWSEIP